MQVIKNLPQILILAGLILILGLLFFYFYFIRVDIIKVKSLIRKELQKTDLLLFFPDWEKNDILSFDGLPVITSKENQYINLYGFKRLFIVKNTKYYRNSGIPVLNDMLFNKKTNIGIYSVEEFSLYSFNLSEHTREFRVYTEDTGKRELCPLERERHRCGRMGWQYVGMEKVDIDGQRAECIWAHPIGGKKIIIEAALPPTLAGNFVFYRALASTSGFDTIKPAVSTTIFINDEHTYSSTISHKREWIRDRFTFKAERPSRLRIEIFTPQEYKNHFCFNLEAM